MEPLEMSPYLRLIQRTGNTKHPGGFKATDMLLKRTNLKAGARLLDVGCGAGHTSAYIAKNYDCTVSGVDVSPQVLERARALHKDEPYHVRMTFDVANAINLPFSDGYFDVVLCESVLFFIHDKEAALKEMARVVKPSGFLAINELCLSKKKNLHKIRDYFLRPEFGGFLTTAEEGMAWLLHNDQWKIILHDEEPFDVKEQIKGELKQLLSKQGILHFLESAHQLLVHQETREDFLRILKFLLEMPKNTLKHLNAMLLLAQKAP